MAKRDVKSLVPDYHLWQSVTETVDPLKPKRRKQAPEAPLPLPDRSANQSAHARFADNSSKSGRNTQPFLAPYQAPPQQRRRAEPGIDPKLRRKLARGRMEIGARIDLHGMRQDEARAALHRFLPARAARGDRTVLVITGKGVERDDGTAMTERGVLRAMLPIWLAEPALAPLVSGYSQAARSHGGDGAFYVRLRLR
ncbi:DNA mismatch repair protein MutS [Devosia pacifica]|uniref:DNA mismatch repair protein MutS n=1 Tax=Devosia pacifica TaxID=1335967 RepID=A0A918S4V9_9HYPH|nr:Smr/MutS family protein [Devosia pacifica]GHA23335.1 DNA mismatch repair protein MutS [Devosia pacifica]